MQNCIPHILSTTNTNTTSMDSFTYLPGELVVAKFLTATNPHTTSLANNFRQCDFISKAQKAAKNRSFRALAQLAAPRLEIDYTCIRKIFVKVPLRIWATLCVIFIINNLGLTGCLLRKAMSRICQVVIDIYRNLPQLYEGALCRK